MPEPKLGTSSTGEPMHYSVGAVIRDQDGNYLMVDRLKPPYGWACPAGHVDEGEDPETAIRREVWEETGLTVTSVQLLGIEEVPGNTCRRGINTHHWCVYACETTGMPRRKPDESEELRWLSADELSMITLEPVWRHWFVKLHILPK